MSNALGQRIRNARRSEGLTQESLGKKLGVAQPTIAVWESTGKVPKKQMPKLEEILGPLARTRLPQAAKGPNKKLPLAPEADASEFGVCLREQRNRASMSIPKLSEKSGVSTVAIYNIESGKSRNPQEFTRNRLAKAFGKDTTVPSEVVEATEKEEAITGLGSLTDFDPHSAKDYPLHSGVYVLYDASQRPIYVGKAENISSRLKAHEIKFWFKGPIVRYGAYIEVVDKKLRHQLEQALIKFLKNNVVINKKSSERLEEG